MYAAILWILKRDGRSQPGHPLLLLLLMMMMTMMTMTVTMHVVAMATVIDPQERDRLSTPRKQWQVYFVLYLTFER